MKNEYVDIDGYPTAEALTKIRDWQCRGSYQSQLDDTYRAWQPFIEFVDSVWWMPEQGSRVQEYKKTFTWHLDTLGWSGNEDIILAMEETSFWSFFWESTQRGGHYYFRGKK